MPGQFRLSVDLLIKEAGEVAGLGILRLCCSAFPIVRTSVAHRPATERGCPACDQSRERPCPRRAGHHGCLH
jgi:hypothetical protein